MSKSIPSNTEDVASELLIGLGRELTKPLESLLAGIHAVDARDEDDGAADLVELGYALRTVLEPLTTLAALESLQQAGKPKQVELRALLEETSASPELAGSFQLAIRGQLGVSFDDEIRLARGLELCLKLLGRMTTSKVRLQAHREIHDSADRVVLSVPLRKPKPIELTLLSRAARFVGASVDIEGTALHLALPVSPEPSHDGSTLPPSKKYGPVLAFRRGPEIRSTPEKVVSERASIVLVVDNEPAARNYMSRILELEGFDVVTSATLSDAYDAAHAYRPDAITLDRLQLAREEGDWLRRFKEDPAVARIPLVLVQSEESESLGLVGVSDVVRKPIDPDEVVSTIDRLTGAVCSPILLLRATDDAAKWERCVASETRRVVTTDSIVEAERVLDTVTPAAVIVDVGNVSGAVELLEGIRRNERTSDVPMIAVHGRLTKKARLQLDRVVNRRITFSDLRPRAVRSALAALIGDGEQSGFGTG